MGKKLALQAVRLLMSANLLYAAIFLKCKRLSNGIYYLAVLGVELGR